MLICVGQAGTDTVVKTAAKAALKRKKAHENSLDQTIAQIGTLEQQINAIESANINRETLAAMQKAGEAMKQIHGKLTPEKVDETMYVLFTSFLAIWAIY
jgi:charged multivesicular body protein 4